MTYNPADYNAVLNNAKEMSKEKLEKIYTDDKSKRHLSCIETIGMIFIMLLLVFLIGGVGYVLGEDATEERIGKRIDIIEDEICPILGEDYKSQIFFTSIYYTNRIDCD